MRGRFTLALAVLLCLPVAAARSATNAPEVSRGEYVFRAGGCVGCHTDRAGGGAFLAGGRPLKTDFGTFYGPNITPDLAHGLGRWSWQDFWRALRRGISPEGRPYFPAFPYTSFTRISDSDLGAIWTYLRTVTPSPRSNTAHDLRFPYGLRFLVWFWRWFHFEAGPFRPDGGVPAEVSRGRYLASALGHCGECHTPRNRLGGMKGNLHLAGTPRGPEGGVVPNLTPDPNTGLGGWSAADLAEFLRSGMTPDGDFAGSGMGEVVEDNTSRLTDGDRKAVAAYLRSIPPIHNPAAVRRKKQEKGQSEW